MRKAVILSLATGLLLLLGIARAFDLWTAHAEAVVRIRTRVASDALVLAEYLTGTFAAGDAALRQLALHSRRIGGPTASEEDWAPSLASADAGLRGIGALTVLDRDLVIRHANRPALIGVRRDDPMFVAALTGTLTDALIVGAPYKPPVVATPLIPLGRRLTRADGTIEGFVAASFLPGDLRRFFQSLSVGERGTVWVFHTAGSIVVKEPSSDDPLGQPVEGNAIYAAAILADAHGVVEGPVAPGGRFAISGFRRVQDLPLVVAVSLDRDEMLAPWWREVYGLIATYSIATTLVLVVLLVLFRQIDARTAAQRELTLARQADAERLRRTNEQLSAMLEREQTARRDAETANALKDQFVMTVSHELRTPLTAIAGWSRMLVDGMVSEDKRDGALRTIERNAQAQKRLIEDLLDVAGIMAGKLRLDIRPMVVADVMRTAVEAVSPAAKAKDIHLQVTIDEGAGTISADPGRLQQIVWNLLSNAVKFTPAGGTVTLCAQRIDRALRIEVADTGSGISADLLPHVFERFRQGAGGTARQQGGLGLGLAIVRNLVELHGGTITVHSAGEGRGATFEVTIPAARASAHARAPTE